MNKIKQICVPIPKCREPFVNTPIISLGKRNGGKDWFWISSWNHLSGCMGLEINSDGDCRIHRFKPPHNGFYSAVYEGDDTLWLCGDLSRIVRYNLKTRKMEVFPTGAQSALVFQGMRLDPQTKKICAMAFPGLHTGLCGFSFDTVSRKTAKVFRNIKTRGKYMRFSFPNGDDTWSFILHVNGERIVRWNPQTDEMEEVFVISEERDPHREGGTTYMLVNDDTNRWYIPYSGWYNPALCKIDKKEPMPDKEYTWVARLGNTAYGFGKVETTGIIASWDMQSGKTEQLCRIPDMIQAPLLSEGGKIININLYGEFFCYDAKSGLMEISKRIDDAVSVQPVDCLLRIDKSRVLGTPFITQRFWEVNLATRKGFDCGRAAPGAGEILKTLKIGKKVYMAAYAGGEIMEYNPLEHPHFPENPRVVANPPHAMRPMGACDDGRNLFCSYSKPYGQLGSMLVRYDTKTDKSFIVDSPLPNQQIVSLALIKEKNLLLCGTTYHADCQSAEPVEKKCCYAILNASTFEVKNRFYAMDGAVWAFIDGVIAKGKYLCRCYGNIGGKDKAVFLEWDVSNSDGPDMKNTLEVAENWHCFLPTPRAGYFVYLENNEKIGLWNWKAKQTCKILLKKKGIHRIWVLGDSVAAIAGTNLILIEKAFKSI